MFILSLAALKKPTKGKDTDIEKEIGDVLKHANDRRKQAGKSKIRMMNSSVNSSVKLF